VSTARRNGSDAEPERERSQSESEGKQALWLEWRKQGALQGSLQRLPSAMMRKNADERWKWWRKSMKSQLREGNFL
jgi:hypothetical protein